MDQKGNRVGLSLRFERPHDVAGQAVIGRLIDRRWPLQSIAFALQKTGRLSRAMFLAGQPNPKAAYSALRLCRFAVKVCSCILTRLHRGHFHFRFLW
jgi:hypothetical protein